MSVADDYQKALRDLSDARKGMKRLVENVATVTRPLDGWEEATAESLNGPLDKAVAEWVSKDVLDSVVKQWKAAWKSVNRIWEKADKNERIGLKSPGEMSAALKKDD